MILEVRYKGQKINLNDIEVDYNDYWGETFTGSIEDYGRCELHYCEESNLCDESGFGWTILIDDLKHESLASCDVEYVGQIFALIDMYKDY